MAIHFETGAPPLYQDASGALRIGDSRVLLEMVIHAFQDGAAPETIFQRYPSAGLPDIYAVIACYLRYPQDIDRYLAKREQQAHQIRGRVDRHQGDLADLRQRIAIRHGQAQESDV